MSALLRVEDLKVTYGGINAVKGIDLHVNQGELVALIGANGAGKSSSLKAIAGLLTPAAGVIQFSDQQTNGQPAYELARLGLGLVPEGRGVFKRMTILENLQMGAFMKSDAKAIDRKLEEVFYYFPRLKERLSQLAGTLSGGEQQMVAMGRAMMAEPKLLLLDEPSMGLSPIMVDTIFDVVRNLSKNGMTILLVEQNAMSALRIASQGIVLDQGQVVIADDARAIMNDTALRHAYLGY